MRRHRLLLVAVPLAIGLVPIGALRAAEPSPVVSGWWWFVQPKPLSPPPVSTVPDGSLPVSQYADTYDKMSAVRLDVSSLHTVPSSYVLTLQETGPVANVPPGAVIACPIVAPWAPAQGGAWALRPNGDCSDNVAGTTDGLGRWSFDLTRYAAGWIDGNRPNYGVALIPARSLRYPGFQLTFRVPSINDATVASPTVAPSSTPAPAPAPASQPGPVRSAAPVLEAAAAAPAALEPAATAQAATPLSAVASRLSTARSAPTAPQLQRAPLTAVAGTADDLHAWPASETSGGHGALSFALVCLVVSGVAVALSFGSMRRRAV